MKRIAIIMAGGSGERFWPVSRRLRPKQLLSLTEDRMMLESAIERISPLVDREDVYIVTSKALQEPIRSAIPDFPRANVIAEPHKRNTAPCLALGLAFVLGKYFGTLTSSDISVAVLTADHHISPIKRFTETAESALIYAETHPAMVTIGIPPARPETGFGYIETDSPFDGDVGEPEVKQVRAFREKPDYETACKFVESGNFLWNSGMFFYRADTFIANLNDFLPEVARRMPEMSRIYSGFAESIDGCPAQIDAIFETFPNVSIDYAIMEKSKFVAVAKSTFAWDDIGSWDSLERYRDSDPEGNTITGKAALLDSSGNIIYNDTSDRRLVAGLGLEDMIVVSTDDAVLILPKNRVQEVRSLVSKIRNDGDDKWL